MKRIATLMALSAILLTARGQTTGMRYILGETSHIYTSPGLTGYFMGLGLDHTFHSGLTIAFDLQVDLTGILRDGYLNAYEWKSTAGNSSYQVQPKAFGLGYHTEYALGDIGGTHGYIGSFIGYRRITQKWTVQFESSVYDPFNGYEWSESETTVTANLIPIGLRIGVRGAVDGIFVDLYGMVGYQIGGGKQMIGGIPLTTDARYLKTAGLTYTLGLAYGMGW